jgi:hypothetical protein
MDEEPPGVRPDRNLVPQDTGGRVARVVAKVAALVALLAGCGPAVAAEPNGAPVPTPAPASAPVSAPLAAAHTPDRPTIVIDGGRPGPVFQGIGAISGGGGNSRLLIDYPSGERKQILDYLFTPHYGASLQMLKLEIGGGGFSSDGSEPSAEPVQGGLDCGVGYEFWLAHQALARNPAIKIYGLQWSAPAWVSDGHGGLWSTADVRYVVDWLRCARDNGLTISYVGGWNEHYLGTPVQRAWFVNLRQALDQAGFAGTQIVAADQTPQMRREPSRRLGYFPMRVSQAVGNGMAEDPAFAQAVSVVGVHDTCGLPTTGYLCVMAAKTRTLAARLGKPIWESELGATPSVGTNPARPGPAGLARAINAAYNEAGVTGILVWPLVDAMPQDLPHERRGLVWANTPWDGSYFVTPLTWVIAQTTQFTALGWLHVNGANGNLPASGSYVTYEAPDRTAWTLVAQTSLATVAQQVTVRVTGALPARVVHVWSTNLRGPGQFVRLADITPQGGTFTTVLQPGFVYTFTTTTGQSKAGGNPAAVPAAGPMPLPYNAAPDAAGMARMLSPMEGSFGYVHGVLTQTTVGKPVEWYYLGRSPAPYAVVGRNTWRDYTVSARVVLPRYGPASPPTGAALIVRFQGILGTTASHFRGYELQVSSDGAWQLTANGPAPVTLASGWVAAAQAYTMSVTTRGTSISARINGAHVATVTNRAYQYGAAGLASLGYYPVQYPYFGVS